MQKIKVGEVLDIQKIPLSKIKAVKYNPRKDLKPGDAEYEKLRRSIEEFGYAEPVIWNRRTGNIVGRHQKFRSKLKNPQPYFSWRHFFVLKYLR